MKVQVNGIKLGYDVLGEDGYPIVLIHGLGLDRTIWKEMASRYLWNYKVLLPDIRGHGESDAPPGTYAMALLADDLALLLDSLGIEKAVVCGHSMGGYITLAFAAGYPERLAGMGLVTSRAGADSEQKRMGRYQMCEEVQKRGAVALAENLAPRLTSDAVIVQKAYELIARTPTQGMIGTLKGLAERPDRRDLLPTITVPAIVAAGEADQIVNLDDARAMASAFPNGQFLSIPGAGHMPMLEKPEQLGQGLVDLLDRVAMH